jgi:hypothetical protein
MRLQILALKVTTIAKSKPPPTSSQINTKPHIERLFSSIPLAYTSYLAFKKLQGVPKVRKHLLKKQQLSYPAPGSEEGYSNYQTGNLKQP